MSGRVFSLTVNGRTRQVACEARKTLADVIREDFGLTGTHLGCEHGVCGACTVLLDGDPVRACLLFAIQVEGRRVETVESLAAGGGLNAAQQAFVEHHALQCGFCTPGFLMLIEGMLRSDRAYDDAELTEVLASNLCRCTGYDRIWRAARDLVPAA